MRTNVVPSFCDRPYPLLDTLFLPLTRNSFYPVRSMEDSVAMRDMHTPTLRSTTHPWWGL